MKQENRDVDENFTCVCKIDTGSLLLLISKIITQLDLNS